MNAPAFARRERPEPVLVPVGKQAPPHDLDAECAVLSACMISVDALLEVRGRLTPASFYSTANAIIFEAICAVETASGKVDPTLVAAFLRDRDRLETVGGMPYLAQIVDATPAVRNVAEHAAIVAQHARRRLMIATCQRVAAEGYGDVGPVEEWLADSVGLVARAAEVGNRNETLVDISDAVSVAWQHITARANETDSAPSPTISTGFEGLDRRMGGGLIPGCQYAIAGLTGHGKTALALKIALNVARGGRGVVFISAEMPAEQLTQRAICQGTRIDTGDLPIGNLSDDEWVLAADEAERLRALPFQIDDRAAPTLQSIRTTARRAIADMRRRHGDKLELGLVVVDYLQILAGQRRKGDSREQEIAELSQGLLWLAKELGCAILTLSQLNREGSKKERPQLNDLRGSGSIEQDNFGVIFVYREDAFERDDAKWTGEAEAIVAKMRQGGATGTVRMRFHHASTAFYSLADDEPPPPRKQRKPRASAQREAPPPEPDNADERERYP